MGISFLLQCSCYQTNKQIKPNHPAQRCGNSSLKYEKCFLIWLLFAMSLKRDKPFERVLFVWQIEPNELRKGLLEKVFNCTSGTLERFVITFAWQQWTLWKINSEREQSLLSWGGRGRKGKSGCNSSFKVTYLC